MFPQTPAINIDEDLDKSMAFCANWESGYEHSVEKIESLVSETTVVFVRGYLGNHMPGNLRKPVSALRKLGFDSFILKNKSGGTVKANVRMLAEQLAKRETKQRLILCGHSKGGMECLWLLASNEEIAEKCCGVALSQTPAGPSLVMESILQGKHRDSNYSIYRNMSESVQRLMLTLLRARSGGYDLTSDSWPSLVAGVSGKHLPIPVLQTASWSTRPTVWLDSFHARLAEISPSRAHDGQFYLDDMIWPGLAHILLPHLDHAQPVVGGLGFDCARYWVTVLAVLAEMIEQQG